MKIGLASVTYLGLWYDGPGLAPLELLRRARQLGFDGVELDGRRPHGSPIDLDAARRRAIRDMCAELELDMVALAAHTDFSTPVVEQRECQLLMLREQIRLARDLGAPVVRIYLASPGVTLRDGIGTHELAQRRYDDLWRESTWLEAWNRCKAALREVVRYAEEAEVVLALQNLPPVVRDGTDVATMIEEVQSPWLRACVDLAALPEQDAGAIRGSMLAVGHHQVHAHFGGRFRRRPDGRVEQFSVTSSGTTGEPSNYPAFVRALKDGGYDGYLCYELTEPAVDGHHEVQGIDFVDEQAQLAIEYMRDVIAEVERVGAMAAAGVGDAAATV